MKYHLPSKASDPGQVEVSLAKLCLFHPEFDDAPKGFWRKLRQPAKEEREAGIELLAEHMAFGDSRAAVVLEIEPLLIAAYTDELDCVALLMYMDGGIRNYPRDLSKHLCREHDLKPGTRLLTVNTYQPGEEIGADLTPGPENMGNWVNFWPVIAEFVSDSVARIDERKSQISEDEWSRTEKMGREKMAQPFKVRDGRVFSCTGDSFWEAEPLGS